MKPTETLEREHRIIEQVLSCLEKMADEARKGKAVDLEAGLAMVDFFREFADRFHHAKEEQHLFRILEAHGMPRDGGPTGVMLTEHEMGRGLVGTIECSLSEMENGRTAAADEFMDAATAYVHLLREHIQKEDHCLFAMTNGALSDSEQVELAKVFRSVEAMAGAGKGYDHYRAKARELAARFSLDWSDPDQKVSGMRCCGTGSCSEF